jgi:hypothetical protein
VFSWKDENKYIKNIKVFSLKDKNKNINKFISKLQSVETRDIIFYLEIVIS